MTSCILASNMPLFISTHTPSWGVTISETDGKIAAVISTHTPSWGVTEETLDAIVGKMISTHTPSWGVTMYSSRCPAAL